LVVGTPEFEPWHFVAHLAEEAKRDRRADLIPTLERWGVPQGSPAHLAVSVDELSQLTRSQTLLIVSSSHSPELLERISDAKRRGTRIMALHPGDQDFVDLSHEVLAVDSQREHADFDLTQHLITDIAPMVDHRERNR
jgi:DNA-binding MurR/RpiR family transcriptional regulator